MGCEVKRQDTSTHTTNKLCLKKREREKRKMQTKRVCAVAIRSNARQVSELNKLKGNTLVESRIHALLEFKPLNPRKTNNFCSQASLQAYESPSDSI